MAVARIDKRALEKIGLGEIVWDTEVKGFGIRRHTTEAVFYLVRCRCNGRQTFKRIGRHGAIGPEGLPLTPDTARNEAQRLLGLVTSDTNPQAKQRRPAETFRAEVERYLAKRRETMKPRAYEEIQLCSSLRYNCPFARKLPPSIGPEPPIQYVAIIKTNVAVFMSFCSPEGAISGDSVSLSTIV
jgi:hypothetical protein